MFFFAARPRKHVSTYIHTYIHGSGEPQPANYKDAGIIDTRM